MHSVATFQRVRGLSAQQPQVATRRRGSSSPLSGKVRAAGADDSGADPLDRTDRKDTNSSLKALYYNGLRPFSVEEGFLSFLPVSGLQQKSNKRLVAARWRQFASCFRIRLARISLISRWRGTGCETPVVGLRYQSCLPPCRIGTHPRLSSSLIRSLRFN